MFELLNANQLLYHIPQDSPVSTFISDYRWLLPQVLHENLKIMIHNIAMGDDFGISWNDNINHNFKTFLQDFYHDQPYVPLHPLLYGIKKFL